MPTHRFEVQDQLIRLLLRPALLLSGLLLLPVLLLRVQPYDDGGLRAFLTPPSACPAPCFMGIRPNATTVDQVVAKLTQHPWVQWRGGGPLSYRTSFQSTWFWSDQTPAWIDEDSSAIFILLYEQSGALEFHTRISWARWRLAMGRPDRYRIGTRPDSSYDYSAWYEDLSVEVRVRNVCAGAMKTFASTVRLSFRAAPPDFTAGSQLPMMSCR